MTMVHACSSTMSPSLSHPSKNLATRFTTAGGRYDMKRSLRRWVYLIDSGRRPTTTIPTCLVLSRGISRTYLAGKTPMNEICGVQRCQLESRDWIPRRARRYATWRGEGLHPSASLTHFYHPTTVCWSISDSSAAWHHFLV